MAKPHAMKKAAAKARGRIGKIGTLVARPRKPEKAKGLTVLASPRKQEKAKGLTVVARPHGTKAVKKAVIGATTLTTSVTGTAQPTKNLVFGPREQSATAPAPQWHCCHCIRPRI